MKIKFTRFLSPILLAAWAFLPQAFGEEETAKQKASGYNAVRIEQEDRFTVPEDKVSEVWKFLEETLVKDAEGLKKLDPGFTSYANEEEFTDTYFDTNALELLKAKSAVRHRKRINLTNPEDRKSGRELLQIKLSPSDENMLERKEMKFEIKRRDVAEEPEDSHPMLGIVKRSQRKELKAVLKSMGLDPLQMHPILSITDRRTRIYILKEDKPFISISHDVATSELNGKKAKIFEIEHELNEIAFTEADEATRKYMEDINQQIITKVLEKFPYLKRDLTPKYNRAFEQLKNQGAL